MDLIKFNSRSLHVHILEEDIQTDQIQIEIILPKYGYQDSLWKGKKNDSYQQTRHD